VNIHTAARSTGDAGGPGLTGPAPGRPATAALSLAAAEASLLLRSVLLLAGLVAGGLVIWRAVSPTELLWWDASWQIGYGQVILAVTVLAAAQLAAGRPRRDGMRELYDSFPVSAATRTAAQMAGLAGVLPASVLLAGTAAVVIQARGAIGTPAPGVLAAGVLLVIAAGAAGIALGTRFPHPLAGILGALALFALSTESRLFDTYGVAGGGLPWLFPWTVPDPGQLGYLPGPLTGYPPGGVHAVELAGIAALAAAAALAVTAGRPRHRMLLAATGIVAAAAICVSGAAQLQPVPAAGLNRLVSAAVDPVRAEHCTTVGQVRYCLYPAFGSLLPAFQAPVRGVLAEIPARPADGLTIAQDLSLTLDDPSLAHGHTGQQLARWKAELQTAPASTGTAPAIYTPVGSWPAPRFALALRVAEWAVKFPAGGSPGTGCVPADQAREAIAIWLAITATRTSPAQLAAGQNLIGQRGAGTPSIAVVQGRPVTLWTYPAQYVPTAGDAATASAGGGAGVFPAGPQTTATGFLLAESMTSLPASRVERVLDAGWPVWLNWHTTDARLAAALGIPMPSVSTGVSPPPATAPGPGSGPPQAPLCTT
jgi:hypothetical protein